MGIVLFHHLPVSYSFFFFFNDTATTEIYTLSLHDALPIWAPRWRRRSGSSMRRTVCPRRVTATPTARASGLLGRTRSEEHTSELQSQSNLVCRLLLEKKNNDNIHRPNVIVPEMTNFRHSGA